MVFFRGTLVGAFVLVAFPRLGALRLGFTACIAPAASKTFSRFGAFRPGFMDFEAVFLEVFAVFTGLVRFDARKFAPPIATPRREGGAANW